MNATKLSLAIAAVCLVALPLALADGGEGEVAVGVSIVDTDDSLNRASEYREDDSAEAFRLWWESTLANDDVFLVELDYLGSQDQLHRLRWNPNPSLRLDADFNRFVHNLPHDPLTNLAATDGEGKVIRHDDFDPQGRYRTRFELGSAAITYQPQNAREWILAIHARQMKRSGGKQLLSTGHCMTCHIVSQAQALDEEANDVTATIGFQKPNWGVRADLTQREFNDNADDALRYFELARQPVTKQLLFTNRTQYSDVTLPVGVVVGHDRLMATVSGYWTTKSNHVDGALANFTTESESTALKVDYSSARLRFLHNFGNRTSVSILGRYEDVRSDDIFVNVVEQTNPVGVGPAPAQGRTYAQLYGPGGVLRNAGFVADFTRKSALDRTVLTTQADVAYRFGADLKQRVKVALRRRSIDRDNVVVDDSGETETEEYRLRGTLLGRFGDAWRYRAEAELLQADNTFKYVNGGVRAPGVTDTPGGTGPFFREQYFELYRLRFGDLTSVPSDAYQARANFTYTPSAATSITVFGTWKDQENDETNVGSWSREALNLSGSVWWAPARAFGRS
ncbi:MAG: hypothetical protein HC882_01505 [Acidobacteria bacterium]|nr:hypothetical protein [Acidobacteriota bacterium]